MILQVCYTTRIVSSVFQECLVNIGVSKIRDKANGLFIDSSQNILKIILLICLNGILNEIN
jgi:hypothetical protein